MWLSLFILRIKFFEELKEYLNTKKSDLEIGRILYDKVKID